MNNFKHIINEVIASEFSEQLTKETLMHFQRSVIKIINTEHQKISFLQLEKDDLTSQVFLAIKEVKEKYDINKNVPLIAYANFIIKRRILDYAKFLKRDKRKITIQMINSYRSGLTDEGQTFLERDIDRFSFVKSKEDDRSNEIKELFFLFIEKTKDKVEKKAAMMLYKGYSQKEIIEKNNITRKDFLKLKEKLKKFFNYFIKDISKL
ncbi:hypothetical protein [Spiroplasma monobiae]|uniref:Uncharacterized protein n=1 Tax=Spiroplasma monobiae MQ-1 TaxID=1336748 RepID=A0A2K9LVD2_SPISQ|nr:hypothetical protein [Spiroplasma monobiae]AUM62285.1 hypothetical protein SMONO_v1c00320 [Spiroplasma monobiae MQ-1]